MMKYGNLAVTQVAPGRRAAVWLVDGERQVKCLGAISQGVLIGKYGDVGIQCVACQHGAQVQPDAGGFAGSDHDRREKSAQGSWQCLDSV